MDRDVPGREYDFVSGFECVHRELTSFIGGFLFLLSEAESSFRFLANFGHLVKAEVEGRDIEVFSGWNHEVRSEPIEDFERGVLVTGVYS